MPRNASGTYTLPAGNPVVVGTTIDASWANTTMDDMETVLTDSLSRSGDGGMLVAFQNADGSEASPGLTWTSETTSGFYRAATNDMRASIGSQDRARFRADATNPLQIWSGGAWVDPIPLQTWIAKVSDESVNNSSTLQDDDEFVSIPIAAATYYRFEALVWVTSADPLGTSVAGFKMDWVFSQTPVISVFHASLNNHHPTGPINTTTPRAGNLTDETAFPVIGTASGRCLIKLTGYIISHATTAGTLKLQWAQDVATATQTTIKRGSFIHLSKVA